MTHSPGHKKWPEHKVEEVHNHAHIGIFYKGQKIADTEDPILLTEDNHPDRYYIPRQDVNMQLLQRTSEITKCPYKGTAHYYSIKVGEDKAENAVWTYEEPYVEHADIKDRLAFYTDKFSDIEVRNIGTSNKATTNQVSP